MKQNNEPRALEVALTRQVIVEMAERDMSQTALAEHIGISRGAMNRYLNNRASLSYGQIIDLAAAFNLEPSELIARAESRLP